MCAVADKIPSGLIAGCLLIQCCTPVTGGMLVDFDALSRDFGTWTRGNAFARADQVKAGFRGSGLRFQYAIRPAADSATAVSECGLWLTFPDGDLSSFQWLELRLKGDPEGLELGLKDALWFEQFIALEKFAGTAQHGWRPVRVPLRQFEAISDWYAVTGMSLVVRSRTPTSGELVVDSIAVGGERPPPPRPRRHRAPYQRPAALDEETFLHELEKWSCFYFWYEADAVSGLVKDRCKAFYRDAFPVASIAAVGFGLACLCVADARGWLSREAVYRRVRDTLRFFREGAESVRGFFYHFLEIKSGRRAWNCELSSIDTALLVAGALFAGEYFAGTEVQSLADEIYRRVDWQWMLNGGVHPSMGWTPEGGFLPSRWSGYNEGLLLLILGCGSPTHPIDPRAWWELNRDTRRYGPFTFAGPGALFVHQYPHLFIDFRFLEDGLMDYYLNSVQAALAARRWAVVNAPQSRSYGESSWGLTACDGPEGYRAYGSPFGPADGTVAPSAAGGSLIFTPDESLSALSNYYRLKGGGLWGRYGFVDSFNADRDWISDVHIAIDQAAIALAAENYRSGLIWNYFMRNPHVLRGLRRCGFRPRTITLDELDLGGIWEIGVGQAPLQWNRIRVPAYWERSGLPELRNYDGYAVYRRIFHLPEHKQETWADNEVVLELGGVDDADELWVNEVFVGRYGRFPPQFSTAWSRPRQYSIPAGILCFGGSNSIVLRVYDGMGQGGIWKKPVRLRVVERYPVSGWEQERVSR